MTSLLGTNKGLILPAINQQYNLTQDMETTLIKVSV